MALRALIGAAAINWSPAETFPVSAVNVMVGVAVPVASAVVFAFAWVRENVKVVVFVTVTE
jgi:hypothetical protein